MTHQYMGYIELSSARIKWHLWHESRFKLDAFLALLFRVVKTFALMQHTLWQLTVCSWCFSPRPKSPKLKPFFLITIMQKKFKSVKKNICYSFLPELPANWCQPICPPGLLGRHWLPGSSKGNPLTDVFLD